ncbi:MAG TPA: hypothetical protein VFM35_03390 [Candidatus Binatia bacterium]|nr:hypothetical protein [Candidatus Binatia bacterium]
MPEQISKYPDVTLEVLKGAGAVCGKGGPQNILKKCPAERFCSLPTGEICVYGIKDIPQMTQVSLQELAPIVYPGTQQGGISAVDVLMIVVVFVAGLVLGKFWHKVAPGSSRSHP